MADKKPYYELEKENARLTETLEWATHKCNRQGKLIAGLCDYIDANKKNHPEALLGVIRDELSDFLLNEASLMQSRIKERIKNEQYD